MKSEQRAVAPNFFDDDLAKWKKRFDHDSIDIETERKRISKSYHYEFNSNGKQRANKKSFVNVDVTLLNGNVGEVI